MLPDAVRSAILLDRGVESDWDGLETKYSGRSRVRIYRKKGRVFSWTEHWESDETLGKDLMVGHSCQVRRLDRPERLRAATGDDLRQLAHRTPNTGW